MPAPIKPTISIDDLKKSDIRAGTIERVDDIANSEKLVQLTVNFGDHRRYWSHPPLRSPNIRFRMALALSEAKSNVDLSRDTKVELCFREIPLPPEGVSKPATENFSR